MTSYIVRPEAWLHWKKEKCNFKNFDSITCTCILRPTDNHVMCKDSNNRDMSETKLMRCDSITTSISPCWFIHKLINVQYTGSLPCTCTCCTLTLSDYLGVSWMQTESPRYKPNVPVSCMVQYISRIGRTMYKVHCSPLHLYVHVLWLVLAFSGTKLEFF